MDVTYRQAAADEMNRLRLDLDAAAAERLGVPFHAEEYHWLLSRSWASTDREYFIVDVAGRPYLWVGLTPQSPVASISFARVEPEARRQAPACLLRLLEGHLLPWCRTSGRYGLTALADNWRSRDVLDEVTRHLKPGLALVTLGEYSRGMHGWLWRATVAP